MGFTRNYKNILMNFMHYDENTSTNFDNTNVNIIKDFGGGVYYYGAREAYVYQKGGWLSQDGGCFRSLLLNELTVCSSVSSGKVSPSLSNKKEIAFGTGTNDESIDDYTLSLISTISQSGDTEFTRSIQEDGSCKTTVSLIVVSSENATINEIGIVMGIALDYWSVNTSGKTVTNGLIWRKKLDTPINLIANTPAKISFDIIVPNVLADY